MKPRSLPVKRQPVSQGIFKRLHAATRGRKQRAATAAAEDGPDDHSSRISRALTIIFLIHIVAIAMVFVHQKFLDGHAVAPANPAPPSPAPAPARQEKLPVLSSGDTPYIVKAGDNYAKIAAAMNVDEAELRRVNEGVDIRSGLILKIPPKRIVAADPPEVAALREHTIPDRDRGLVEAVPVGTTQAPPKAILVRPQAAEAGPAASGERYTVQSGDSVWRIANRFKVDQDALMRANGITDPRKLKVGMNLVIPR